MLCMSQANLQDQAKFKTFLWQELHTDTPLFIDIMQNLVIFMKIFLMWSYSPVQHS